MFFNSKISSRFFLKIQRPFLSIQNYLYSLDFQTQFFHTFQKARNEALILICAQAFITVFNKDQAYMTKKYQTKKMKKAKEESMDVQDSQFQSENLDKQKKIVKAPKVKETILSDIELQIVEMFSRSFSNGQIGVKFPQQKKKGMMRLMNFCFRTILQEVQMNVSQNLKKEAHTSKCIDRKERTIFHLSSNYRYKHIQKTLLEDFKTVCKHYVKYHCVQHLETKFLQKFYKKVIYNDFSADTPQSYKAIQGPIFQVEPKQDQIIEQKAATPIPPEIKVTYKKSPKKYIKKIKEQTTQPKRKYKQRAESKKIKEELLSSEDQNELSQEDFNDVHQASPGHMIIEQEQVEPKSNKICIEKINIYFGYDSKGHNKKQVAQEDLKKLEAHPYARMEVEDSEDKALKRKWTYDMESELTDQFMNSNAHSPNIIIRNMMKKFGRNRLFVESQIQVKKKEMFKVCISKFLDAFDGKTICSQELVNQMEIALRDMTLSPKNFFIASFIHDFYFKEVQAISVTLLTEYINKLSNESKLSNKTLAQLDSQQSEQSFQDKKKILQRSDIKYAINTVSKLVSNYSYDMTD